MQESIFHKKKASTSDNNLVMHETKKKRNYILEVQNLILAWWE